MKRLLKKSLPALLLTGALVGATAGRSLDGVLAQANAALQAGQADKALSLIASLPEAGQDNADALNIACRVEFALGQWDAAVRNCEHAVRLEGQNADFHMWLGRALGEKANKASFLTAFSLGKRVLAEFQTAARLDPRDAAALADLGAFYVEAPSVVGGGLDKAESVAKQLDRVDAPRAAELRARIAQERGDFGAAEDDYKKSIAVSRHPALQWSNLARFYQQRKRWDDMESALHNCIGAAAHDPHSGVALYDGAGVLISAKHDLPLAIRMLQDYLAAPSRSEEAPAFVAYSRLSELQQNMGDAASAQASQAAALEMAREYKPAQDLRR